MCGIAGVAGGERSGRRELVARLVGTLSHRGPDSWGVHDGVAATIGQTRLAVIDLLTGDPPITNEDGSIGVALNGEIYNFSSIRNDLHTAGHHLRTSGDTETIAHLAEDLEPVDLAARLDGMFAFAVSDDRKHRLILGRDRLGKKPLYYWCDDDLLVFGSELKALLAHPRVPHRLEAAAIPAFLTFGYVPTPRTFFEGIHSVPPGHVLVFEKGRGAKLERYWAPPIPGVAQCEPLELPLAAAAASVRECLEAAVRKRMVADVPIGAFLSGGLDSSTVVGIMAGLASEPIRTFTIGFEDSEGFDERPHARLVADRFRTDHVEFVVRPDSVDLVERLVYHHDQPFGDSSSIPTFLLSELTRKHVKVALCGDGGDELFAGYQRFSAAVALERVGRLPWQLHRAAERAVAILPPTALRHQIARAQRLMSRSRMTMPAAYRSWICSLSDERVEQLVTTPSSWALEEYQRLWDESDGADLADRLLNLNLRTYLLDDLLPKVDRMSMAHGLEVRSPLLDTALVELASRMPHPLKMRGLVRKRVLRAAVTDLLPKETLQRRKHGFGIPLDRWFRTDLKAYVEARLLSPDSRIKSHLDAAAVEKLWSEHQAGASNGHSLWSILSLEVFLRAQGW